MADTKRVSLYLDTDAVALLADLAPSDYKKGKYISGLIREAARRESAQEQSYRDIGRTVVEVVQQAMRVWPEE
jgi:hypothetical protein